jgi:hypothetical protein
MSNKKDAVIQLSTLARTVALTAFVILAACGPRGVAADGSGAAPPKSDESGYLSPPSIEGSRRLAGGRILLFGRGPAGSRARLATPAGDALLAPVDNTGAWRLILAAPGEPRLYGLSVTQGDRSIQAQGYVAVTPTGAALLRAGAGAVVFVAPGGNVRILALDFDRKGGAVISGIGPPNSPVKVSVDGVASGSMNAGANGRFSAALDRPLAAGAHRLEVTGAGSNGVDVDVSLAVAPAGGPFQSERVAAGWRIDWMTPGGGIQSTLLFDEGAG